MTIRCSLVCNLCGKEHEYATIYAMEKGKEMPMPEMPEGWKVVPYPIGERLRQDITVCSVCDKAIRDGTTIVGAYLRDTVSAIPLMSDGVYHPCTVGPADRREKE